MLWLIGQIALFILIGALIGFIMGWLLRGLWPSSRSREREGELHVALQRAGSRISDLEAGLRAKRAAVNAAAEQEEAALQKVERLEAELSTLHSGVSADTGEMDRLQTELDDTLSSISSLRAQVTELQGEAETLAALQAERDAAGTDAADSADEMPYPDRGQVGLFVVPDADGPAGDTSDDGSSADGGEPEESPEEIAARLEEVRLAAVADVTERFRTAEGAEPDDLKQIHGIGPVLQEMLHSMNILTFRQIADFTPDDVELVSAALGKAFPDRINRDDWMSGARELHREKYGDDQ